MLLFKDSVELNILLDFIPKLGNFNHCLTFHELFEFRGLFNVSCFDIDSFVNLLELSKVSIGYRNDSIGNHFGQSLSYSFVFVSHVITDLFSLNLENAHLDFLNYLLGDLFLLLSIL